MMLQIDSHKKTKMKIMRMRGVWQNVGLQIECLMSSNKR